jgi:hypothetical protein
VFPNARHELRIRIRHWDVDLKMDCQILRRNCLLRNVIQGKMKERIEVTGKRGRRRNHLMDGLKEKTKYWKEEALDHTLLRTRFGMGYGPVVRHAT